MSFSLLDLTAQVRTLGRASVFYATVWDGLVDLPDGLTHLGDTEGPVTVTPNQSYSDLTLPELTGDAIHERYLEGFNPVVTIPLYDADATLATLVTPTASPSMGYQRRRLVTEKTLVIFPEPLFIEADAQAAVDYSTAGGWTVGGDAATAAQLAHIDNGALWFWRGHFTRADRIYRHEDAGKCLHEVTFQTMHADIALAKIPDGQRLVTFGDPVDVSIDIHPSG